MTGHNYSDEFLARLKAVKSKRARVVIDHILKHGFITTETLETVYGYKHPPRAARDVREQGIPLETFNIKNAEGRTIAAYRFGDPSKIRRGTLEGRKVLSRAFKKSLIEAKSSRCAICTEQYEARYLQVDHRVPYEIAGDQDDLNTQDYMLLCGSCNRAKSWSCEHCINWLENRLPDVCRSCYWANPESYKHIALRPIRRLDVVWQQQEVELFEKLKQRAEAVNESMPDYVKRIIEKHLQDG